MLQARGDGGLDRDGRLEMMWGAWSWVYFESEPVGFAGGLGVRCERTRRVKDDPAGEQLEGLELPVISQFVVKTAGDAGWWGRWDGRDRGQELCFGHVDEPIKHPGRSID